MKKRRLTGFPGLGSLLYILFSGLVKGNRNGSVKIRVNIQQNLSLKGLELLWRDD